MLTKRLNQLPYLLSGLTGRLGKSPVCPACASQVNVGIDRKGFHSLLECQQCFLVHRFPTETPEEMASFYDDGYAEPGLTTDLPSEAELKSLLDSAFIGSGKDFSHQIRLLEALGMKPGMRILDFGANWGYTSWQFRRFGYETESFEISRPRAAFATKLGMSVVTSLEGVHPPFDTVFSSHVLEHVPNPLTSLREQLALTRKGGLVVAHTPNGSRARLEKSAAGYHQSWGQVHPVLLTDRFVQKVAGDQPYFISSVDRADDLSAWDQCTQHLGDMSGPGLFFVIVRH